MIARQSLVAAAVVCGVTLAPTLAPSGAAHACGGFFCNATPVDQQAERIIFVQEDDNTVTSYVEITYQGDPEAFAWVVPVPAVPELGTWHGGAFNAIDLLTQPQFDMPWGCFFDAAAEDADGGGDPNVGGEVNVLDQQRVGPFDTATIESDDPRALVEWLRLNEYRITPAMEPFVALYTAEGMKFLALKLAPGEDTDAIAPIKMTYTAAGPAVPLRLTSVAAALEMGVKVWILGDSRFGPLNVPEVEIDDSDLRFDPITWQTNYAALVARKVDDFGGKGFVTELAGPTEQLAQQVRESFVPEWAGQEAIDARDGLAKLLESKPYITRLYTRLSPEEMDIDPMFGRHPGDVVSNRHVVPEPEDGDQCGWDPAEDFDACDFAACGAGGACAEVAGDVAGQPNGFDVAGCACAEGALARAGLGPDGRLEVGCADARLNFTAEDLDVGNVPFVDVCTQGDFCGDDGECVMLNGFPSCRCDAGFVAVGELDEMGMPVPRCVAPITAIEPAAIALIELPEPNLPYPGKTTPMRPHGMDGDAPMPPSRGGGTMAPTDDGDGCSAAPGSRDPLAPAAWLLALPLLGLALRRR